MKKKRMVAVWFASLALLSCGAIPSEGPGGPKGVLSESESLEVRFVSQIVLGLRDSFVEQDRTAFMKHVSEGFYLGYERLARNLEAEFAAAKEGSLQVNIIEVSVNDPRVTAVVEWIRTSPEGAALKTGTTELIFQRGDTVSLVNFRKDALFGISGF